MRFNAFYNVNINANKINSKYLFINCKFIFAAMYLTVFK
jgi:hypothetical protein